MASAACFWRTFGNLLVQYDTQVLTLWNDRFTDRRFRNVPRSTRSSTVSTFTLDVNRDLRTFKNFAEGKGYNLRAVQEAAFGEPLKILPAAPS